MFGGIFIESINVSSIFWEFVLVSLQHKSDLKRWKLCMVLKAFKYQKPSKALRALKLQINLKCQTFKKLSTFLR